MLSRIGKVFSWGPLIALFLLSGCCLKSEIRPVMYKTNCRVIHHIDLVVHRKLDEELHRIDQEGGKVVSVSLLPEERSRAAGRSFYTAVITYYMAEDNRGGPRPGKG